MATTMNKEYLALNSKLFIRNGWLNDKRFNIDTQQGLYRYITFVVLTGALVYLVYEMFEENRYGNLFLVFITIVWIWPLLTRLYRALFIHAWRTNIRVNEITEMHSVEMETGVETKVVLKLKNGRIKEIVFRNAENQLEPFMNELSFLISKPVVAQ